jgi:Rrf2 family protein
MKLNQKVRYGLECLFELAKWPGEYVEAERLSHARGIPPAYTQKILQSLTHAGLLYSQKGSGYRIARPLQDITALEVIDALSRDETESKVGAGDVLERHIDRALASVTLDSLVTAA